MIQIKCKKCGHYYSVSSKYAGKSVRCKPCGFVIQIPSAEPEKAGCSDSIKAYNQLLEELSHYEKNAPALGLDG
ncbi:MAG: hypothetical protein ABFD79_07315 [Phycisphaerales bacterium]